MQRPIELPDDQVTQLEQLAAREHRSLDEVVQFALGDFLARQDHDWTELGQRWDALVARIQAHVPTDMTPEEIEANTTAAHEEYRAEEAAGGPTRPE